MLQLEQPKTLMTKTKRLCHDPGVHQRRNTSSRAKAIFITSMRGIEHLHCVSYPELSLRTPLIDKCALSLPNKEYVALLSAATRYVLP